MTPEPGTLYKAIVLRLGMSLEASGAVDQVYFDGFLRRNHRGIKAAILAAWPSLPLPRREDYRACDGCAHVAHHTDTGPHAAILGILCPGRFHRMSPPGKSWAEDHHFNGLMSRTVARWGLCGRCWEIHRVMRDGRVVAHRREIDVEIDGVRKRTQPDCEGGRTVPVAITPPHPQADEVRRLLDGAVGIGGGR